MIEGFATAYAARFHIETHGDENAPETVLMLHGFTGSAATWRDHAPYFVTPTRRVIAVDLIGHGQTDAPPPAAQIQRTAVELIRIVLNLTRHPIHLLGYSMGGRQALYLALLYPGQLRSLILESASPGLKTEEERAGRRAADHALADRIEREGITAFVDYWESLPLFATQKRLPDQLRARLREQRLKNDPVKLANSLRMIGVGAHESLWELFPHLKIPMLLIAGELDEKYVQIATEMHALMPTSQLSIVPDAGHNVHLEQPELFRQAVVNFLDSLP